jgi:uncharacterized protein
MSTSIYFEIQADGLDRAENFYKTIFNWKFKPVPVLPVEYRSIDNGGTGGGLLQRPAKTPPNECGTNAFTCSFEVKDFDETSNAIKKLNGIVALPKFAVPGKCWQGYFLDTEGNVFGIFQLDEKAG